MSLEQKQTTASHLSQLEFRTFRFREIDPSLSTCLRFKTIISKYNRHDMKRNTSCKFVELLHPPLQCTWLAIFRTTFSAFLTNTSKHANYRIIVFWIWRHIRPSTHAPLNSVVNQKWRLLDVLWRGIKIRGFNQIKKIFAPNYSTK